MSDVDGYTIVARKNRSPKVHLLRPWNECNTEKGKSGRDTVRVGGSRESLYDALAERGYRRGDACRRCFPGREDDRFQKQLEMGDPEITTTLDKYDDVEQPVESTVAIDL